MARAAYRLVLVILAALIAAPAGAGAQNGPDRPGIAGRSNGQTIPFSSVAPEVVVPPGEEDDSADNPNGGPPDADRGGPPDDAPPIDAHPNANRAIPA